MSSIMIVRITDEKDEFFGFTEQARADITHEHCRIFIAVSFIWMLKGAVNRSLIVPYHLQWVSKSKKDRKLSLGRF